MDHYATSEFLLVYRYSRWDFDLGEPVTSSEFFTLDAIKDGLGTPLTDTGIKVLRSAVDANGRYAPEETKKTRFGYLGNFVKRPRE